jgi:DNA polymerase V
VEQYRLYKNILCIDLKSFYASVECAIRGLDPFTTPLIVADKSRGDGSIVLAVSPYLRRKGMPSRCRIHEVPNDPEIIYAKPRMHTYLEYSAKIISIYLDYVSSEDMHIYSVDEVFLDVTSYLSYYQKTDIELAKDILKDIWTKTHIPATCGIGPNMLLSKIALDVESKYSKTFIAKWGYEDVEQKLWNISPLSEMWGIGHRMEKRLNYLGIKSVGDLAHYPLEKMIRFFGVMGAELWFHAHGIDQSILQEKTTYKPINESYGVGQMLFRDYQADEISQIILEMVDDVTVRLRKHQKKAYTIHLGIMYSKANPGGFGRQIKLEFPTSYEVEIYEACMMLFDRFYDGVSPIRKVSIRVSQLVEEVSVQMNLFRDMEAVLKQHQLKTTIDQIAYRYGRNSVFRGSSLKEESTALARHKMVGGHHG